MQAGYHLQSLSNKIPLKFGNNILLQRDHPTNYENLNLSSSIFVTNYECFNSHENYVNQTMPMPSSLFLNHIKQFVGTLEH